MAFQSKSLETAIELEEQGYQFYKKTAAETDNKFSKQVLNSLAQQELEHKQKFEEIAAGQGIEISDQDQNDNIKNKIIEIFADASEDEKEKWKDGETKTYEKALEMEKKTYNFYKEMAEETDSEQEQKFLEALMEEESKHEESIQNVIYYITDYDWWIADDESQTWNWMNM